MNTISSIINPLVAPLGILLLIFVDYARDRNTCPKQRGIYNSIIWLTLGGMAADFGWRLLEGRPGQVAAVAIYLLVAAAFWLQVAAYSRCFVLLDYVIWKDEKRTITTRFVCNLVLLAHALALLQNWLLGKSLYEGFYFYLTPGNQYVRGPWYFIRVLFVLMPVVAACVELVLSRKDTPSHLVRHLVFFTVPTLIGVLVDLALGSNVIWSFIAVEMLFAYLFIIRQDADRDSLTGLYNRRKLQSLMAQLEGEERTDDYTFVMIDLDNFKEINDRYGHLEGDNVLHCVASAIQGAVRRVDFVARYGGDEFLVIAKGMQDPAAVVRRIRRSLQTLACEKGRNYSLEFSAGYALLTPQDERSPHDFLDCVDALMYKDKMAKKQSPR